ncbi:MAG: bifunctional folylpolyglutamate synthase/dihydrofolate synthase, partial [Desulfobacterales bacterium]|nr:bifunctional folylpolyglutamate synthase/dihydrofolate synthase [Desulfobacterales bacterium]
MAKNYTYRQTLDEMFSLRRFGIKLGLGTIRSILKGLDNPHHHFHCIHIAGTNGKGSVASTLASILTACGYKTGLYTSPH